jgi:hypothetical protein
MGALDRLRQRVQVPAAGRGLPAAAANPLADEEALRASLTQDPNDVQAFARLAEIVRRRAAEHDAPASGRDPQDAADDAVWALAEELAHSGRAWYPLIELARLSIDDDREAALRRLGTAAERDPSGTALARGLRMLRDTGHPDAALNVGVGHWRPREHDLEAGRQLVEAALEAGRPGEAKRHLEAFAQHPDRGRAEALRRELERVMNGGPVPPAAPRVVDVRDSKLSRLRSFLRL